MKRKGMRKRRGMGKGRGMGYYNLVPNDSYVHSMSAKGVKTMSKKRFHTYDLDSPSLYKGYAPHEKYGADELFAKGDFAKTIYQQLGGGQFSMMTGAKNFVYSEKDKSLRFRIGRNAKGVNMVKITLTPQDLYDVEFLYVSKRGVKVKNKVEGIYNDQLKDVFEENTGLYTRLFAMNARGVRPLKGAVRLEVEQAVTIPSTELDKPVSPAKFKARVKEVERYLSKSFGGKTSISADGGFYSQQTGRVIEEPVVVVQSFADSKGFKKKQDRLRKKLEQWKKDWKQESVAYQVEDDLYLI